MGLFYLVIKTMPLLDLYRRWKDCWLTILAFPTSHRSVILCCVDWIVPRGVFPACFLLWLNRLPTKKCHLVFNFFWGGGWLYFSLLPQLKLFLFLSLIAFADIWPNSGRKSFHFAPSHHAGQPPAASFLSHWSLLLYNDVYWLQCASYSQVSGSHPG